MSKIKQLPPRSKVKPSDCWNLGSLCKSDGAWETSFKKWEREIPGYEKFADRLGESAKSLAECLEFDIRLDCEGERLGTYAFLKTAEDTANSTYQRMIGRYRNAASRAGQAASFIRPEIMAIPTGTMKKFLAAKELAPHRVSLERLLRYKPHTLTAGEEKLLAMQAEMSETSNNVFRQLADADLKFGLVKNEKGQQVELSNATFSVFLHSPKRNVRKAAFHQYYAQYKGHENTLAAALAGSMERDVYYAKARGYKSALGAALFHDNMPASVYDNLIAAVHKHLPALYRYVDLRRRKMKLPDIHHYDTYVPILNELEKHHTWDQAVKVILESLAPLGNDYCGALSRGLNNGWCDRYPNQGKQSGGFSSGTFTGDPYIMMNYQPEVLDHVFTLTHEAGHSMHSYYSAKHQPYQYYNYTIFVAEVASTFNEQLLSRHLRENAKSDDERAFLINRDIDAIRGTIIRQTMFAEFEKITHATVEAGEPLTVEKFKEIYRGLLKLYFGPDFVIDDDLTLEFFRIPHFYRAFYVYKYATGLSAAIALSQRVVNGGQRELDAYLGFLKGGCSEFPLDLLRVAGVDMEKPEPVETALKHFGKLVDELDELL
ncbi:MAG TPA: oligoendopeptidase F [Pirellulales bacterium]|jgi:oligoendopeptidase F|nr:oligoendopeptidase F [Pirellulales bacterium]